MRLGLQSLWMLFVLWHTHDNQPNVSSDQEFLQICLFTSAAHSRRVRCSTWFEWEVGTWAVQNPLPLIGTYIQLNSLSDYFATLPKSLKLIQLKMNKLSELLFKYNFSGSPLVICILLLKTPALWRFSCCIHTGNTQKHPVDRVLV